MKATIIIHGFKTTYEMSYDKDGKATGKKDRPVDWVTYSPAHAAMFTQISERVEWLRPPENIRGDDDGIKMAAMRHKWAQIERGYDAWKSGHEIPVDGTALGAWPGINEQQAQAFRAVGIKTVEQVAEITDAMISRVQLPSVRELKAQAKAFLEAFDRTAISSKVERQDEQIKVLQEQLAAAMELLEQQTKPKRGKQEVEAAAA
jgi:hypothetical protein